MRIDTVLLERASAGARSRPLLRLYSWDRPSLSVGAHQRLSEELAARCASSGVPMVRRPSGGTAVLHAGDLTYAVVAPTLGMGVLEAYRSVAAGLLEGLRLLGIEACVGSRRGRSAPALDERSLCFATTAGADLSVAGAKICGSAQVRRRDWFLQHGSIPLSDPRPLARSLLRFAGSDTSTCVDRIRPGTSWEQLAGSLASGFQNLWGAAAVVSLQEMLGRAGEGGNPSGSGGCLPKPLVTL
ncbi:MAG TPA: lipoate--protein ligase family protein [Actinomycetota bacterium]|nr:lipoate--protein ligase family protein [Actinomycetota bacterium]